MVISPSFKGGNQFDQLSGLLISLLIVSSDANTTLDRATEIAEGKSKLSRLINTRRRHSMIMDRFIIIRIICGIVFQELSLCFYAAKVSEIL